MKNKQLHKSIHEIKKISLLQHEKEKLFEMLSQYADTHTATQSPYMMKSPYALLVRAYTRIGKVPTYVTASLFILLLVGGSTVYASQHALPGDVLYPVKVNIAEPLQVALAFTPNAKQQAQVSIISERLKEVEALAVQDKLSTTTAVEIQHEVDTQVNNIKKTLSPRNAEALDSTLAVHVSILRSIARHADESQKGGVDVVQVATQKHINTQEVHIVADQQKNEVVPQFSDRKNKIEQDIKEINNKIQQNSSHATVLEQDILNTASSSAQSAQDNLNKAQDTYTQNKHDEARVYIQASEKNIQEASMTVEQGLQLGTLNSQSQGDNGKGEGGKGQQKSRDNHNE